MDDFIIHRCLLPALCILVILSFLVVVLLIAVRILLLVQEFILWLILQISAWRWYKRVEKEDAETIKKHDERSRYER